MADLGTTKSVDKPPDRRQLRTVLLSCVMGTTIEWYDFFLYGVAAGLIFNKQYFPSHDPVVGTLLAFATFAVGFVARPIGGLIFGHIGDKVGRKKSMVMTMMIMGVATFLIGCIPTYATIGVAAPIILVVLRVFQGLAVGGEWGGAVLMSVEYAPKGRRTLFGSVPQMGLAVGLMLGTGIFAFIGAIMSDSSYTAWGWRITFWLSLLLVVVGMMIRLKVMESPAFIKLEERQERSQIPARDLVASPTNRRNLWLGMGARWVEGVAFNAWAVFSISYASGTLHLKSGPALISVMIGAAALLVFIPVWGYLGDRFTSRRTYLLGVVLATIAPFIAFPLINTGNAVLLGVGIVLALGILYPVLYAPEAAFFADLFPVNVRYTGISVVYQMSGIVASGLTPLVLTFLLDRAGGGVSLIIGYFVITGVISAVCTLMIRPQSPARTKRTRIESALTV
ncbi:MFS transporter [Leekyejoonella antrihumi]|uniref:Putative proline/betaine transporter n=1 Tax=Leekyejoonella antrihumi TaxID=1660198 RepID=A0A563E0H6_9MICO|nr:MFS transporter [Leekyejoonella antrihumi]TWP36048.1 MHS family MFS transporter [Leekyejoonella antrihumi]